MKFAGVPKGPERGTGHVLYLRYHMVNTALPTQSNGRLVAIVRRVG